MRRDANARHQRLASGLLIISFLVACIAAMVFAARYAELHTRNITRRPRANNGQRLLIATGSRLELANLGDASENFHLARSCVGFVRGVCVARGHVFMSMDGGGICEWDAAADDTWPWVVASPSRKVAARVAVCDGDVVCATSDGLVRLRFGQTPPEVVLAAPLDIDAGLCGDGTAALARTRDGRIVCYDAKSGGTRVIDAPKGFEDRFGFIGACDGAIALRRGDEYTLVDVGPGNPETRRRLAAALWGAVWVAQDSTGEILVFRNNEFANEAVVQAVKSRSLYRLSNCNVSEAVAISKELAEFVAPVAQRGSKDDERRRGCE